MGLYDYIYNNKNNCVDKNAAKSNICIILRNKKCDIHISDRLYGLSLIISQYLINDIFNIKQKDRFDRIGLKSFFEFVPKTSIKNMYDNLSLYDKNVFKCIFNEDNYEKEYKLISYKDYQ